MPWLLALLLQVVPLDPRCEGLVDPAGLETLAPRLSWRLAESDRRGERQTAYQIRVWSRPDARSDDLLWDSGRVESDNCLAVPYAGPPAAGLSRCWWRVRVWDGAGQQSDWSPLATWSQGPAPWRGQWIGAERGATPPSPARLGYHAAETKVDEAKWVQVDLGSSLPIDEVRLHPLRHDGFDDFAIPLRWRVDLSDSVDGEATTPLFDGTAADQPRPGYRVLSYRAGGAKARYVRFSSDRLLPRPARGDYCFGLAELEVISGGRNVALRAPATAKDSVEGWGWALAHLTDGEGLVPPADQVAARRWPHGVVQLRREFALERPAARAVVLFSGLGYSSLRLDGRIVGDHCLAPGFTTYNRRVPYLALDVTDLLARAGRHVLDVRLADGWYGLVRDPWVHQFHAKPYIDQPKLLLELHVTATDGSETVIASDDQWRWAETEVTRSWIAEEDIDARLADPAQWRWRPVKVVAAPEGRLVRQMEPFSRVVEEARPTAMTWDGTTRTATWDFGRELAGRVRLRARGPAGTTLRITTLPTEPLGRTSAFTLAGTGADEVYEPFFGHAAMRRVTVTGLPARPRDDDLVGCVVSSMHTPSGDFQCSDDEVNWLYDCVRRTVVNYTTWLPNDPVREWKAWVQDIQTMFWSATGLFDSRALYDRWQQDLLDGQDDAGNFPNIAPGPGFDAYNSPWWGGAAVWLPWEYYVYYGDDRLLRDSYPAMRRYVDYLDTVSRDGLQQWGLLDWLPLEETPVALINTPAHIHYARIVSRAAALLGKPDDAAHYAQVADRVRARFNSAFLDPATGIYGLPGWQVRPGNWTLPVPLEKLHEAWWPGDRPCTQAAQALALGLDLAPAEQRPLVEAALRREIVAHHGRLSTGFVSTPYLLRVLTDLDPELAWNLVTTHEFPSWWSMTRGSGNDLLKETWAGGMALMPSLGGSVAAWCREGLAGLRPDPAGPGYRRFIVRPALVGGLRWARTHYEASQGRIAVAWQRDGDHLTLDLTVPTNTTATVLLPAGEYTESGRPATQAPGIRVLAPGRFEVGSGRYRFARQ